MPLGIYISVPFCRTKCSYCNFASDVFSRKVFESYVDRVCADIAAVPETASAMGGQFEPEVDSMYLGGGTPTLLESAQLQRVFAAVRDQFALLPNAEVTVECAPGTLTPEMIDTLLRCGVNRVSLGVQSFIDGEAAAVGRLHKRATVVQEIARLRASGIANINIDLIAGATLSHALFAPKEDAPADFYTEACEKLNSAGIAQYEISNFARLGFESRHNLKYWTRQPYLGFGVDAHSMLKGRPERKMNWEGHDFSRADADQETEQGFSRCGIEAVRFANADLLEKYIARALMELTEVSRETAVEEAFFLGLRLTRGISLEDVTTEL